MMGVLRSRKHFFHAKLRSIGAKFPFCKLFFANKSNINIIIVIILTINYFEILLTRRFYANFDFTYQSKCHFQKD